MLGQAARFGEPLRDDGARDRGEEVGVGARPDRDVLVGVFGGLAASRVDDHDRAAAGLDPLQSAGEVRRRTERTVGRVRVRAEQQHEVGAIEVGDGHGDGPEHHPGRHLLRSLVDRGRREPVPGTERQDQRAVVQHHRQVVGTRIAEVDRTGIAAVPFQDREQAGLDHGERLVPVHLHELAVPLDHRPPEPVRVLVEVAERRALRAEIAL